MRLDPKTWRLLEYLVDRAGQVVSKDQLLAEVWEDVIVSDAALSQAVLRLRTVLGDDARAPRYIETVHRRGLRFIADVQEEKLYPATGPAPTPSMFVGRERELARLDEARSHAEQGQRQVVMVRGEMGIGKTTLIDEFTASLPSDWLVLCSQCVEQYGSTEPFMPLLEAVDDLVKSSRGPEVVGVLRRQAPTLLGQIPWIVDEKEARELGDVLAAGTRPRMLRETASALEALCGRALLLIIEDLHWCDPATLDLLALIARRRGSANLMILGSFRDGEAIAYAHPVVALVRELELKGQCVSLPLEPLAPSTIDEFMKGRFGSADLPASLVDQLHDRTDGNPLFLHTLVDHMIDVGWLVDDGGQWELRDPRGLPDGTTFPSSLRQMIGAFVDRIDSGDLETLEAGSVVGVTFSAAGVAAALERPPPDLDPIEAACTRLVDRWHVLRPAAEETWPDGTKTSRYRFRHALFHHALYDRITPSKRRRLHQLVGERMAEGHRGQTLAIAAQLAAHFERSGDDERAVSHFIEAAMGARNRLSENEALGYLRSALERIVRLPPGLQRDLQEIWIRVILSSVQFAMEGPDPDANDDELMARIERAVNELPEELINYPLLQGLWGLYFMRSDPNRLGALDKRIRAFASTTGERTHQIEADIATSTVHLSSGRFADATAAAELAWESYRAQSEENAASGLATTRRWRDVGMRIVGPRATAFALRGELERASNAWQDALDTVAAGPTHPFNQGMIHFGMAACQIMSGDLSGALENNRLLMSLGHEHEINGLLNGVILQQMWLDLTRGELADDTRNLHDRWPELRHHAMSQPVTNL